MASTFLHVPVSDDIARKFDKLFLDNIAQGMHRGQFLHMAHTGEITEESFHAELPDVVAGLKTGREPPRKESSASWWEWAARTSPW